MTQLGGGGVLKSRFLAHMKKVKVERYILRSSLMHMFPNAPNRGPRKIQKIWLGDIIDDRDKVHVIIMPDYSALELESFVDRLYCHTQCQCLLN